MIFAAGLGTRMGDLTANTPKPMLQVSGEPLISHAIAHLRDAGVERIVANIHHLPEKIRPFLEANCILVSDETSGLLDTGGGLRRALPLLSNGPVLTVNPDVVFLGPNPINYLLDRWSDEMTALLLLVPLQRANAREGGGDFSLYSGEIQRKGDYVYTGAQIIRTDRLREIPDEVFSLNAYWDLLNRTGALHGATYPGRWCDVGKPEGLRLAEELLDDTDL